MSRTELFNVNVPDLPDAQASSLETGRTIGIITTKQSAITFAGAPVFVTLIWKVLGAAVPSLGTSKLCALVLSVVVGLAIYVASEPPGGDFRDRFAGFLFAFINSFAIAATVLGINTTMSTVAALP
jgi:hypothetical protein